MNKLEFKLRKFIPRIMIEDKEIIPRFYLPVEKSQLKLGYECYFFLVAPFVLLYKILANASWSVWRDLILWLEDIKTFNRNKR